MSDNLTPGVVHDRIVWFGMDHKNTCRAWGTTKEKCLAMAQKYIDEHPKHGPIERWSIKHTDEFGEDE